MQRAESLCRIKRLRQEESFSRKQSNPGKLSQELERIGHLPARPPWTSVGHLRLQQVKGGDLGRPGQERFPANEPRFLVNGLLLWRDGVGNRRGSCLL